MKSSKRECLVVFDAGTQSIRGAVIDVCGNVLDIVKTPIEPYFSARPGWAEQDPTYYWKKFCETSKRLSQSDCFKAVKGVSVTTQRGTYINVDELGEPLRPAIVWLDQRRAERSDWSSLPFTLALKAAGLFKTLDNYNRQCYSNWIRQNQPDIWKQTHKYLLISGFFNYRLTGNFVESLGCNYGYLPVDNRTHQWANKKNPVKNLVWKLFPIEDSKLPELVSQTKLLGEITPKASEQTGLPKGLPVIAAANDKACEILGSGLLRSDVGCISYGTIATINAVSEKYVELLPNLPAIPSAVPGYYYTEMPVVRGFWMVRWFKEQFGAKEELLAKEKHTTPEALFNEMIKEIPPGSDGLILQPYWYPFWTYCGEEGRGSIIGFSDVHSRAHIYRAILEGIAYELKDGAQVTEKKLKATFSRLRVSGGGSQSDAAMQITADVFGLPAERPHTYETSSLGAAIDAAVGLGYYPDFSSAVSEMTRIKDCFQPIPKNRELYHDIYHKVYQKMYGQLKPLFEEMKTILDQRRKK